MNNIMFKVTFRQQLLRLEIDLSKCSVCFSYTLAQNTPRQLKEADPYNLNTC